MDVEKVLKLYDYLVANSSEKHPVTTAMLREESGIYNRKDIYKICDAIAEYRPDLVKIPGSGKGNQYYFSESKMERAEAVGLAISLESSVSISRKNTDEILNNLSDLIGGDIADDFREYGVAFKSVKTPNDKCLYSVNEIQEAIKLNRLVRFKYYHYNSKGELEKANGGKQYKLEPLALVADFDRWYLYCYDESIEKPYIRKFRIDRMENVQVCTKGKINITEKALAKRAELSEHLRLSFKSVSGPATDVKLKFETRLVESIFDKFGYDQEVSVIDENTSYAIVKVGVSKQFYAWVAGSGGLMTIESPKWVKDDYREFIKGILDKEGE